MRLFILYNKAYSIHTLQKSQIQSTTKSGNALTSVMATICSILFWVFFKLGFKELKTQQSQGQYLTAKFLL